MHRSSEPIRRESRHDLTITPHATPGAVDLMHPRPHLRRAAWLSLDGTWAFALDPSDSGEREGRPQGHGSWPLRIVVPFPWESPASGIGKPAPERYQRGEQESEGGVGWYRREVVVPPAWHGDRLWLIVGAAYWNTQVWIDGRLVVAHDGGYDPFEADLTDFMVGPVLDLVIRVWSPRDTDEYPHGKNTRHWYSRASGIWQTVFLEPRPAVHVASMSAHADLASGLVTADVQVRSPSDAEARLSLAITQGGLVVAEATSSIIVDAGVSTHSLSLAVPSPLPWSPDSPSLYEVRAVLETVGHGRDVVETSVGFRTVTVEPTPGGGPKRFILNGQPIYIRAVMCQGYHPAGLLAYPDDEIIRRDLQSAKDLGFNMVRIHVKMDDPRVMAWADRLGILLWCEVPNFLTPSDEARARWEHTWRAMLARDAGHPSIAVWCMFIESWGLGTNQFGFGQAVRPFAEDPAMQAWVESMYEVGRALDSTRVLVENSVSEADHTVAEVNDIHLFPTGYGELPALAATAIGDWVAHAHPGSTHNFAPGYAQADQPLFVSSMAGWSSVDGVETSWPLRVLLNEVRSHDRVCGYGWVQLYDVEWELTGLQTYDRRPKLFGFEVADINADDVLVVKGSLARSVRQGSILDLDVALAHASARRIREIRLSARVQGLGPRWGPVEGERVEVVSSARITGPGLYPLGIIEVPAPGLAFAGRVWLEATDGAGQVVARTFINLATLVSSDESLDVASLDLPLAGWRNDEGSDVETVVGEERQRIGAAALSCDLLLPLSAMTAPDDQVLLEAEVAVDDGRPGQTTVDQPLAGVVLLLDGAPVARERVTFLRADSAGTLSIVNPAGEGAYGGRIVAALGAAQHLIGVRRRVTIMPARSEASRQVVLFGPRLGLAPAGPRLLVSSVASHSEDCC
jgi:Glycosyl hydrolases family 2, sugar binding domain/Glycosyl hydrolases family 2/Glycosyl hydrolases family 2, TIM barrel domain